MKKFIIKSAFFALGVGILSVVLIIFKVSTETAYSVLFHLKNEKLAQVSKKPKLIIIGGSNARYGFDSQFLEQKLGRPVINAAITYHQGLSYYLDWTKLYLKAGDYVLISPEYALTSSKEGLYGSDKLLEVAYKNEHLGNYLLNNPKIMFTQLKQGHYILNQSIENLTKKGADKQMLLTSHNENGDAINCIGKSKHFVATKVDFEKPSREYYDLLNQYAAYCRSKNIKVFISYPPVRMGSITMKTAPQEILVQSRNNLDNLVLLNTPESTIYPDNYFFDSSYHLNEEGKKLHTSRVYMDMAESIRKNDHDMAVMD